MPENSPTLSPIFVAMLAQAIQETGTLAVTATVLLSEGRVDRAKQAAALYAEGRQLLKEAFEGMSPEGRTQMSRAIQAYNAEHRPGQ